MGQDNSSRKTQKKADSEKKQKEPKKAPKKGESAELSLTMFNQGQSIEAIAKERGLVLGTIMGHLAGAVKAGKLTADKVIPAEHVREIRHALSQFDEHAAVDDILAKCPQEIKKEEIYFMLNSMR